MYLINETCIIWSSRRQATAILSTTEAELFAASEATKESLWLRIFLLDVGYRCVASTLLNIDNRTKNDFEFKSKSMLKLRMKNKKTAKFAFPSSIQSYIIAI